MAEVGNLGTHLGNLGAHLGGYFKLPYIILGVGNLDSNLGVN